MHTKMLSLLAIIHGERLLSQTLRWEVDCVRRNRRATIVPLDFRLEAANVMVGWRYWRLGNKYARKENNQPVRPYKDIDPKVDFAGKSKEFKKLRKQYSDWNKVYTYIEAKLDLIAQPNSAGWRTKTPSHYQTLMTITSRIIPDGKILGVNKRATQPSQNSVSTVCRLIRLQNSVSTNIIAL